jgi:hypothetical protein
VDSNVLIAAMHARDAHHAAGLAIVLAADGGAIPPLLLTDFLLAETLNYLARKGGSAVGREALRRIEASRGFKVDRVSDEVYAAGKNDVFRAVDGLSFVDALSVAYMRSRGMTRIYSFDADFDRVPRLRRLSRPSA